MTCCRAVSICVGLAAGTRDVREDGTIPAECPVLLYTEGSMPSTVAATIARQHRERLAALTPAERVALVVRMGQEGLAAHMAQRGVDRATARAEIAATRRAGRRRSGSAEQV